MVWVVGTSRTWTSTVNVFTSQYSHLSECVVRCVFFLFRIRVFVSIVRYKNVVECNSVLLTPHTKSMSKLVTFDVIPEQLPGIHCFVWLFNFYWSKWIDHLYVITIDSLCNNSISTHGNSIESHWLQKFNVKSTDFLLKSNILHLNLFLR